MRCATCALALLASIALEASASAQTSSPSAQTLRVVAAEAVIRTQPDRTSAGIATVKRGTVLDAQGRWGEWYMVSIPGEPGTPPRTGYVAASDVATPSAAPTAALGRGPLPADWQARYDRAHARLVTGKALPWVGLGVGLGGMTGTAVYVIRNMKTECSGSSGYYGAVSCQTSYNRKLAALGILGSAGAGLTLVAIGVREERSAKRELDELEREKARLQGGASKQHKSVTLAVGPQAQLTLRIAW